MQEALGSLYDVSIPLPDARYVELSLVDSHQVQRTIQSELISAHFSISGPQREESWSDSWAVVRDKFEKSNYDLTVLDPPYVSANPTVRWLGGYIRADSPGFEMEIYRYIRESVFRKYMNDAVTVHDVGAGSCFNTAAYAKFNIASRIIAYDWAPASQDIANMLRNQHKMRVFGQHLDLYNSDMTMDHSDIVMTTCALEQLGERWGSFLYNVMKERPRRVVHIEPIFEKYYEDRGFDEVAREYHLQRNYLKGYYPELLKLRDAGHINILCDHRTGIGSKFHECYTVLVWEPR
jgi:hypothetical protein